jgi:uncharacterized protein YkwD
MNTSALASASAPVAEDATPTANTGRNRGVVRGTVLALLFGLIAAFLAVPQAASASTSHARTSYEYSIAKAVVHLINLERKAHHLKPVTGSSQLNLSSRRHNVTMARFNSMSHQLPGEAYFSKRISATGYKWRAAGENIAWNSQMNTKGVLRLETAMYNEKAPYNGHRLNILNPAFKNVGADVYIDRAHHKIWLTTDFARR